MNLQDSHGSPIPISPYLQRVLNRYMQNSSGESSMVTKIDESVFADKTYMDDYDRVEAFDRRGAEGACPVGASAVQHGGSHYLKRPIQPWDYIVANNFDFWQGNILKYISRWKDKDGLQDLEKARHYIEKYIEVVRNDPAYRK